jgi:hypothetical protein
MVYFGRGFRIACHGMKDGGSGGLWSFGTREDFPTSTTGVTASGQRNGWVASGDMWSQGRAARKFPTGPIRLSPLIWVSGACRAYRHSLSRCSLPVR